MLLPNKDIVAISIIYRKINLWQIEQFAPLGLSYAHVPILIVACREPGISQNRIVQLLILEKSVVAKSIGKLIRSGYLTREQNKRDKRAYNIYPTDKALAIYPNLIEQEEECMTLLTNGMSDEEKSALSTLLDKMVQNLLSTVSDSEDTSV